MFSCRVTSNMAASRLSSLGLSCIFTRESMSLCMLAILAKITYPVCRGSEIMLWPCMCAHSCVLACLPLRRALTLIFGARVRSQLLGTCLLLPPLASKLRVSMAPRPVRMQVWMSWGQARQFWMDNGWPEHRVPDMWQASPKREVPFVGQLGQRRRAGSCVRDTRFGPVEVLALVDITVGAALSIASDEPGNDPDEQ